MIVLHAAWLPRANGLALWAEDSTRPRTATPRKGRPSRRRRPEPHPFALDTDGIRLALANSANQPDRKITVFAGQDREATDRARSYFEGYPPSSPAVAILRDGKLVYLMQRSVIEQSTAQHIASELTRAFDEFCAKTTA